VIEGTSAKKVRSLIDLMWEKFHASLKKNEDALIKCELGRSTDILVRGHRGQMHLRMTWVPDKAD
jgi:hypothetical protein